MQLPRFLLLSLYIFSGNVSLILAQSASQPSAAQASSALVAAGAGIGNSLIATSLGDLAKNATALGQAISNGFSDLLTDIEHLLNPELQYSYGKSPPVYPSRESRSLATLVDMLTCHS